MLSLFAPIHAAFMGSRLESVAWPSVCDRESWNKLKDFLTRRGITDRLSVDFLAVATRAPVVFSTAPPLKFLIARQDGSTIAASSR